ncbi:unnamed protein product, partial [Rotaria magnacalcarata]
MYTNEPNQYATSTKMPPQQNGSMPQYQPAPMMMQQGSYVQQAPLQQAQAQQT